MLVTTKPPLEDDPRAEQDSRVLDAQQIARRNLALMKSASPTLKYGDIALLFRAMTQVQIYESAFRRANIPYQTVLGRGFYEREEITDLIQLLRFLDNKTDEIALAAVLRSPLCGILRQRVAALRCAPWLAEVESDPLRGFSITRALRGAFAASQRNRLTSATKNTSYLIARRLDQSTGRATSSLSDSGSAAFCGRRIGIHDRDGRNFDGAQRLANVERLFTLAARFESSGTHLIRDFVRYVEEFEAIGSRESEGQIDQAADAVRLMTIHQAKGSGVSGRDHSRPATALARCDRQLGAARSSSRFDSESARRTRQSRRGLHVQHFRKASRVARTVRKHATALRRGNAR